MSKYYNACFFLLFSMNLYGDDINISTTLSNIEPNENEIILRGLDCQNRDEYNCAKDSFLELLETTEKKEYLIELMKLMSRNSKSDEVINYSNKYLKIFKNDIDIMKLMVNAYIQKKDYQKAKVNILKVANITNSPEDYEIASNLALLSNDYGNGVKYLVYGYNIIPSDNMADKISSSMITYQNKIDDALAFLETHSKIYGCSKLICTKIAQIYLSTNNINSTISTYKKMYEKFKDKTYGDKIIQLYVIHHKSKDLIEFLKKTKYDDNILLEAYKSEKDYKNGSKLALKIFHKTKNYDYLGQSAILKFEDSIENDKKPTKEMLDETIKELKIVIEKLDDDVYQNYLGYLLIDYDVDIKLGIKLIKDALKKQPTSIAYLDSLAWGYFKDNRCAEAFEVSKKIKEKDDNIIIDHINQIKKCYEKTLKSKTLREQIR